LAQDNFLLCHHNFGQVRLLLLAHLARFVNGRSVGNVVGSGISGTIGPVPVEHCLREAGAGGSNPLTPTRFAQQSQQLRPASARGSRRRGFPRKPCGSPLRKIQSHFASLRLQPDPGLQPDPPPAPAREEQSPRSRPSSPPDRPARSPRPSTAPRITSPSAGSGSHLARTRDRGRGRGLPPPGALGPIGRAGGPGQTLIMPLYNEVNGLGEIHRRVPIGAFSPEWLRPRRREGLREVSGVAETRPKPLRNGRESREKGRGYNQAIRCRRWAVRKRRSPTPRRDDLTPPAPRPCAGRRNRWLLTRLAS
jgi:hypothetical protein